MITFWPITLQSFGRGQAQHQNWFLGQLADGLLEMCHVEQAVTLKVPSDFAHDHVLQLRQRLHRD
jgi:hypothetical protein